jgi:hypothetical protein
MNNLSLSSFLNRSYFQGLLLSWLRLCASFLVSVLIHFDGASSYKMIAIEAAFTNLPVYQKSTGYFEFDTKRD